MSFVEKAESFLSDQGDLASDPNQSIMIETVRYLLTNAKGYDNRKSTNSIIQHLKSQGYSIKREHWETAILGKLRSSGIFIGSKTGGKGGIFVIGSRNDAQLTRQSYKNRIKIETDRLKLLENQMRDFGW